MSVAAFSTSSGLDAREIAPQLVGAASSSSSDGLRQRSPPRDPEPEYEDEENYVDQDVPTPEERKWSRFVVCVSAVDILISFIMAVVAFRYAYRANGVSLYCLGMQALSHFLSSILLTVRFAGELSFTESVLSSQSLLRRSKRKHLVREQILSETMGCVMLISAAALLFKAFRKIQFWDKWYLDHRDMDSEAEWATEFLAWYGFSVYLLQAIFRFAAGRKLDRRIIWHAFVASVVSLIFLFVLGFAASYEKEWSWKAEPIAAIALSFVTLVEGVRIIILHLDDMDIRLKFDPRA